MATTQDVAEMQAAKQEIIDEMEHLSLQQLRRVLGDINQVRGLPKGVSGPEFVAWVSGLRDKFGIMDEEFDQFDAIL